MVKKLIDPDKLMKEINGSDFLMNNIAPVLESCMVEAVPKQDVVLLASEVEDMYGIYSHGKLYVSQHEVMLHIVSCTGVGTDSDIKEFLGITNFPNFDKKDKGC